MLMQCDFFSAPQDGGNNKNSPNQSLYDKAMLTLGVIALVSFLTSLVAIFLFFIAAVVIAVLPAVIAVTIS